MSKALDYNKLWAVALTIAILVLLDYLGIDLNRVVEGAAVLFATYSVPNGRLPLQKQDEVR